MYDMNSVRYTTLIVNQLITGSNGQTIKTIRSLLTGLLNYTFASLAMQGCDHVHDKTQGLLVYIIIAKYNVYY